MNRPSFFFTCIAFTSALVVQASADTLCVGAIDDAYGYSDVHSAQSSDSAVVTRIKKGEKFRVYLSKESWWAVATKREIEGYIQSSRVNVVKILIESDAKAPPGTAWDSKNRLRPDPGYGWLDPSDPSDLMVSWRPGMRHRDHAHVIASDEGGGRWLPEPGYKWIVPPTVKGFQFAVSPISPTSAKEARIELAAKDFWEAAQAQGMMKVADSGDLLGATLSYGLAYRRQQFCNRTASRLLPDAPKEVVIAVGELLQKLINDELTSKDFTPEAINKLIKQASSEQLGSDVPTSISEFISHLKAMKP